ncbi:MAG: MBL fold metallo-hydrolase [Chloroflexi bacterium]|nr:MBL fold metallo-hydrolase [Chloroflexota bacterium]
MELTWLGHSCFRLRSQRATVLLDPFNPSLGYPLPPDLSGQVVTITHDHPGHNNAAAVGGSPRVVRQPGEYQVSGMLLLAIASYHDDSNGEKLGKNTIFCLEADGLWVCHLGDLGHLPSPDLVSQMAPVHVLLVPVGGTTTLSPSQAVEAITRLEPRVVVPMHYQTPAARPDLAPVERFLKEMGIAEAPAAQPRLTLTRSNLPQETRVVLLDYAR